MQVDGSCPLVMAGWMTFCGTVSWIVDSCFPCHFTLLLCLSVFEPPELKIKRFASLDFDSVVDKAFSSCIIGANPWRRLLVSHFSWCLANGHSLFLSIHADCCHMRVNLWDHVTCLASDPWFGFASNAVEQMQCCFHSLFSFLVTSHAILFSACGILLSTARAGNENSPTTF